MTRFGKLMALPAPDRRLVLQAAGELAIARLGARVLPLRVLQRVYGFGVGNRRSRSKSLPAAGQEEVQRIRWAMVRAQAVLGQASCVPLALATHALLARRGLDSEVRIGVARDDGGNFRAHAWVESGGSVVVGQIQGLAGYAKMEPSGARSSKATQRGASDEWS